MGKGDRPVDTASDARNEARELFQQTKPVWRLVAAFVLYARNPDAGIDRAFQLSDQFIARAARELEAQ